MLPATLIDAYISKNGAMRIRTADPLNAIEVLYQLSYNPRSCFIIMT